MIRIDPIKPGTLRRQQMLLEIRAELLQIAREIHRDFLRTVQTWENKPEFRTTARIGIFNEQMEVMVDTDDMVYRFLNNGTPAHWIEAVQAEKLRFHEDYIPKTYTWLIEALPGGEFGDNVYADAVWHPGVEAREFDQQIKDKWNDELVRRLAQRFGKAVHVSGHAIQVRSV